METRCLARHWTTFGSLVVVIVAIAAVPALFEAGTLRAQTPNSGGQTKSRNTTTAATQEPAPPDHYDPDDSKTWPDVINEDRNISLREQQFTVHFYRPRREGTAIPAIYACGDGGWRGLAPRTAAQMAHMGFAVAGIDSKVYLRQFSSLTDPLTIKQLAHDYVDIAKALRSYANVDSTTSVYVYGWSLGAGFAIAVGSDTATRANWAGIVSIGLPRQNQLVSGVGGNHASLSVEANARYGFRSQDLIALVSPVPLVMIQSSNDTASPPKVGQALFDDAKNPKRYIFIEAGNHRFSGGREEFYAALGNAVKWMREGDQEPNSARTALKAKSSN